MPEPLKEASRRARATLKELSKEPKAKYFDLASRLLDEPLLPRMVHIEAIKLLLVTPSVKVAPKLTEMLTSEKYSLLHSDIIEELSNTTGKTIDRFADSFSELPLSIRRRLAHSLSMNSKEDHPLFQKALEDENEEVRDWVSGEILNRMNATLDEIEKMKE